MLNSKHHITLGSEDLLFFLLYMVQSKYVVAIFIFIHK